LGPFQLVHALCKHGTAVTPVRCAGLHQKYCFIGYHIHHLPDSSLAVQVDSTICFSQIGLDDWAGFFQSLDAESRLNSYSIVFPGNEKVFLGGCFLIFRAQLDQFYLFIYLCDVMEVPITDSIRKVYVPIHVGNAKAAA